MRPKVSAVSLPLAEQLDGYDDMSVVGTQSRKKSKNSKKGGDVPASPGSRLDSVALPMEQAAEGDGEADELSRYPSEPDPVGRQVLSRDRSVPLEAYPIERAATIPQTEELVTHSVWLIDALVVATIVVSITIVARDAWRFAPLADNPLFGTKVSVLDVYGLKNLPAMIAGQWWRLITPIFLHVGIGDLVLDILVLIFAGVPLENAFGFRPVAFVYLTSGLLGVLVSSILQRNVLGVASGCASAGLLGARLADIAKNDQRLRGSFVRISTIFVLLLIIIEAASSLMPLTNSVGNAVGFVMGALAAVPVLRERIKIGGIVRPAPFTLVELCAAVIWTLVSVIIALDFNAVVHGGTCFYCTLPAWWPGCSNSIYWSCNAEVIRQSGAAF
ncbi:rhomboid protease [Plasmodiophora brassicae]